MDNQVQETTSSTLEAAAMDLKSTNQSNTEPIHNLSSKNGSSASSHSTTKSVGDPMENHVENTSAEADAKHTNSNVSARYGSYDDYQLLPDAPWPPPVFVRQDISPQERYYIEHRWYSQWSFFDTKATQNKNRYYRTQLIVGIGSVSVPVLVGINATGLADQILYFVTVAISLSVAMATAVESLYTFGDNWRSYRSAAEDMRQEKSLYDVKAGRYANNKQAFVRFVERCEEIIAQQNGRWVQSQEKVADLIADDAENLLDRNRRVDEFGNAVGPTSVTTTQQSFTTVTTEQDFDDPDIEDISSTASYSNSATSVAEDAINTMSSDYEGPDTDDPASPTSYG